MFKKIDHIEVVTAEPEKIAAFYTDVLGFRPKFRDSVPLPDGSGTLDIEYLDLAGQGEFLPQQEEELQVLLDALVLEKAVYELGYEEGQPKQASVTLNGRHVSRLASLEVG